MNTELIRSHAANVGQAATAILAHLDAKGPAAEAETIWSALKSTGSSLQAMADHLRPEVIAQRASQNPDQTPTPSVASSGAASVPMTPQPDAAPAGGEVPKVPTVTKRIDPPAPPAPPPSGMGEAIARYVAAGDAPPVPVLKPDQQLATVAHLAPINEALAKVNNRVANLRDAISNKAPPPQSGGGIPFTALVALAIAVCAIALHYYH